MQESTQKKAKKEEKLNKRRNNSYQSRVRVTGNSDNIITKKYIKKNLNLCLSLCKVDSPFNIVNREKMTIRVKASVCGFVCS